MQNLEFEKKKQHISDYHINIQNLVNEQKLK